MKKRLFFVMCSGLVSGLSLSADYKPDTFTKALHYYDKGKEYSDKSLKELFLKDPDSPYSELRSDNDWVLNDLAWVSAWDDFQSYYNASLSNQVAYNIITKEAGFTKARPQQFSKEQLNPVRNSARFRDNEPNSVRASVVKAQVDPDIFYKAYQIYMYEDDRYSANIHTLISKLALAVQVVRDRSTSIPKHQWKINGIRIDVVDRFMNDVFALDDLWDGDKEYLLQILNGVINTEIQPYNLSRQYLRAHYRIARLSSAMIDKYGYIDPPCSRDDHALYPTVSYKRCYVDMTDRALWDWYVSEYRQAIVPKHYHNAQQQGFLGHLFEVLMPMALVMEGLATTDFFTASAASEFSTEAAWTEEELAASQEGFLAEICSVDLD
ncbi:hypothetical protein BS333_14685 [Vibrio azureus]|uniref:Uncharacterized protein n=1 Tax=Vibrio azureus NBRC 104587 TaxID=1219077 RepID=U3ASA5_9VIBR|nr:hypothetical protein [Vibrio azureus]AUI87651.1 hypothetical protein BS333_14685 [Vibrio azureus]GAD76640.1 hypothetical protein VAZ01S_049_00070 [Vibrio azureus NBRC 104587]